MASKPCSFDTGGTQVSAAVDDSGSVGTRRHLRRVAVIVPCYNEEPTVPRLAAALRDLEELLINDYAIEFVLVDDGSEDRTYRLLKEFFDLRTNFQVIAHEKNQGIGAAFMSGTRATTADVVCSIDSDCSYDPKRLAGMIPLLKDGVDAVTASPYHPRGEVRGVASWRVGLSRCASGIYQRLLHQRLSCYTCCFRAYRRRSIIDMDIRFPGFVGMTELLWRLDRKGARMVEIPAVLNPRCTGVSKMRTLRTMAIHFRLLSRIVATHIGESVGRRFKRRSRTENTPSTIEP